MKDRTVRQLTQLQNSASTARVLNLLSVWRRFQEDPAYKAEPFFSNNVLNRSLIVKHRLRPNELELFDAPRTNATKVLLPIDSSDLRFGGRYVFVNQRGYDQILQSTLGPELMPGSRGRHTLDVLDELPSFDPFIMREHLKRQGVAPAACYFDISEADMQRMFEFVRREIAPLIAICFGAGNEFGAHAGKLVSKLLSASLDDDMEPLRETLKLDKGQYVEGVFCWKGFLYYKWVLASIQPKAAKVAEQIMTVRTRGPQEEGTREYLRAARQRLHDAILKTGETVKATLAVYDAAFAALTRDGNPVAFRDFLLAAPDMFAELGERLGAVQHVATFWEYRFPPTAPAMTTPEELMDIFLDFEEGLALQPRAAVGW